MQFHIIQIYVSVEKAGKSKVKEFQPTNYNGRLELKKRKRQRQTQEKEETKTEGVVVWVEIELEIEIDLKWQRRYAG